MSLETLLYIAVALGGAFITGIMTFAGTKRDAEAAKAHSAAVKLELDELKKEFYEYRLNNAGLMLTRDEFKDRLEEKLKPIVDGLNYVVHWIEAQNGIGHVRPPIAP